MLGNSIIQFRIQAALGTWRNWSNSRPLLIRALPGGLTNNSYLVGTPERQYVLRLNANNSRQLGIDRHLEIQALSRASEIKLSPAIVYFDIEMNFLVTEYIDGRIWGHSDLSLPANAVWLVELLQTIHGLDAIEASFSIRERISLYKNAVSMDVPEWQEIGIAIDAVVEETEAEIFNCCLCHNDLLASNIIETSGGKLYVLDWEYAAMGHPFFDLAAVVEGQVFDKTVSDVLVSSYLGALPDSWTDKDNVFWRWRVIYCYIDLLWYTVQAASEKYLLSKKRHYLSSLLESSGYC